MISSVQQIQRNFFAPNLIIGTLMVVTNSILIHGIRKLHKLQSVSWRLILALSVSSTSHGIVVVISSISLRLMRDEKSYNVTLVACTPLLFIFGINSYYMIVIITIDRYIHIKFPLRYNIIMNQRKSKFLICGSLIASIITTCLSITGFYFKKDLATLSAMSIIATLFLAIIILLYYHAYMTIKKRTRGISNVQMSGPNHRNPSKAFHKAVLLSVSSMMICCIPYFIIKPLPHYFINNTTIKTLEYASDVFIFANSCTTAVIMIYLDKGLHKFVRGCILRKSTE